MVIEDWMTLQDTLQEIARIDAQIAMLEDLKAIRQQQASLAAQAMKPGVVYTFEADTSPCTSVLAAMVDGAGRIQIVPQYQSRRIRLAEQPITAEACCDTCPV